MSDFIGAVNVQNIEDKISDEGNHFSLKNGLIAYVVDAVTV